MLQIVTKEHKPKKAVIVGVVIGALVVTAVVMAVKKWSAPEESMGCSTEFDDEEDESPAEAE